MSVNIKRAFSCPRSFSLQRRRLQGGKGMVAEERGRERGREDTYRIRHIVTTAGFRCQKQQRTQSIKLSSRSTMRNYHKRIRRESSHSDGDDGFPKKERKGVRQEQRQAEDGRLTWNAGWGFQVFAVEMLYHYFTFLCGLHPATKQRDTRGFI